MIYDLLIGVAASLIASFLTGFFGNKMFGNKDSIVLKVYILFISVYVFFLTSVISVMLNINVVAEMMKFSEVNILKFYSNCVNTILFSLLFVAAITGVIICAELLNRSAIRDHKQDMERYNKLL